MIGIRLLFLTLIWIQNWLMLMFIPSKWEVRLSKEQQLEDIIRTTLKKSLSDNMQAPQIKTTLVNSNAVKVEFTNFQFDDSNPINITEKDEANNLVSDLIVNEDKPIINKHEYQIINSQNNQFPIMSVIGQFHGNYILAEGIDGLYIIDQHAAQERYNFEKFQHLLLAEKVEYQTLLIPLIVEVGNFIQTAF